MSVSAIGSHAVGQIVYHLEWCTKYRRKLFAREDLKLLAQGVLKEIADSHSMRVRELAVAPEHVHCVLECNASTSASEALRVLKGASSRRLRACVRGFRKRFKRACLWSAGKFARTVGDASINAVEEYVREHEPTRVALASGQTLLTTFA